MTTLRSKVIRLAHEKPELRNHLLPLLTNKVVAADEPVTNPNKIYALALDEMEKNQSRWEQLEGLDKSQLKELAKIITNALMKSYKNYRRQLTRLKLPATGKHMTENLLREYMFAQSQLYAPLVQK